jgi:hypothetical protein
MRTFLRVGGMSLAPITALFYGRADRWWAWGLVTLAFLTLPALQAISLGVGVTASYWAHADGVAEFVGVSGLFVLLRKRFWNA